MSESQSVGRWEYKTVWFPVFESWKRLKYKYDSDAFDATLNRFDSEGWELLSSYTIDVGGTTTQIVAIFKRPRS
jgi:hypothetical protein